MPRIPATHVGTGPDGSEVYRPIIILTIEIAGHTVGAPGLVDSGADNSLVPWEAIAPLAGDFRSLPRGPGGYGPGGALDVRPCSGVIRWNRIVLMTTFMVAEPGKGPVTVLLGRADFFRLYVPRFQWHRTPPYFDLDPVTKGR